MQYIVSNIKTVNFVRVTYKILTIIIQHKIDIQVVEPFKILSLNGRTNCKISLVLQLLKTPIASFMCHLLKINIEILECLETIVYNSGRSKPEMADS